MRLDHIAYRTANRHKSAQFFVDCLGYKIATEFPIVFDDGSKAECLVLEPPEKSTNAHFLGYFDDQINDGVRQIIVPTVEAQTNRRADWHLAPEVFISDGTPDSIVGKWVAERGGIGGIHHIAYQVDSVEYRMADWKAKGYAEFSSDPIICHDQWGNQTLKQVFTKPSALTGVVYELIERGADGFCKDSVRLLMESTVK